MVRRSNGKRGVKAAERARHEGVETYRSRSSTGGTGREEPSPSPRTIGEVEPGHHLCCIYETEEEHRAVLVPFLRHGLEGGQKVLYILDARDAGTILGYLREDGLDPEPYLERGQLSVLTAQDVYLKDGVFDPDAMIALLRSETDQALAEGYAALRVTGEMSWALRGLPGSERLIEYETKLNRFFPGSKCLAICQYDRRAFSAALLLDVLSTHPIAVIGTTVHDNLYYVPPAALLGPDPQAARLRVWMGRLSDRKGGSRVSDENGEVEYSHTFHADTTEHKRTEEALRLSEADVKALLNAPFDPTLLLEADGTIVDLNETAAATMGATVEELVGKNVLDLIPPDLVARRKAEMDSVIASGEPFRFEDMRDGRHFDASGYPVFDSQGNVVRVAVFASNITERKLVEETLRQERRELEIRNRIAGIFLTVPDDEMYGEVLTVILEAMASRYGVFGYVDDDRAFVVPSMTRDIWDECQVPNKDIVFPREVWGESTWPRAIREKRSVFSNEPSTNVPKGHIPIRRHISCPVIHQGEVVGLTQVANKETDYDENDIRLLETINSAIAPVLGARLERDRQEKERARAEEELRRSEANVKALLNAPFDSALLCEPDGTIVDLNEPAARRMGATVEELVGKNAFDLFPPDLAAERKAMGGAVIASGEPVRFEDERDGMCFDISLYPVFDSQGAAVRMAILASDITERKRAEQERNHAHAKTEAIIRATPDMMFIVGGDGTYLDFLAAAEQRPLFPPSEFLGRTVLEVMPADLARKTMHLIEATLESGEMHRLEYELDTSDGKLQYEARYVVAGDDKVLAIVRDVTAQKRLEEREAIRRARDELEGKVERDMLGKNPYGLTFREFTVLRLVTSGSADKEIADQLGISTFTVNKHVANILSKMNASSRTEAGVRALREGLLT